MIDNISNALAVASVDAATGRRMFLFLGLPGCSARGVPGRVRCEHPGRDRAPGAGDPSRSWRRPQAPAERSRSRSHSRSRASDRPPVSCSACSRRRSSSARPPCSRRRPPNSSGPRSCRPPSVSSSPPSRCTSPRGARSDGKSANNGGQLRDAPSPLWRRYGLDVALVVAAVVLEIAVVRGGTLDPPAGSVYSGTAISLPTNLLSIPVLAWVGGVAPFRRLLVALASHVPVPAHAFRTGRSRCPRVGAFDVARPISLAASSGLASS